MTGKIRSITDYIRGITLTPSEHEELLAFIRTRVRIEQTKRIVLTAEYDVPTSRIDHFAAWIATVMDEGVQSAKDHGAEDTKFSIDIKEVS